MRYNVDVEVLVVVFVLGTVVVPAGRDLTAGQQGEKPDHHQGKAARKGDQPQ